MGGSGSTVPPPSRPTPPAPPPAPPLLSSPWRSLDWYKRSEMKEKIRSLKVSNSDVEHLHILVHGPVGAGKSSFINSIDSIFMGHMTTGALAEAATDRSFTNRLYTHKIRDGKFKSYLPFVISDVMGLEKGLTEGVHPDDLISLLKGHLEKEYKFSPTCPCTENDRYYRKNPTLNDKVHCLVSVLPADKISLMDDDVFKKMREIRQKASGMRIPQLVVLTKVDLVCPEVRNDIKVIYTSKRLKEKMQECSNRLGAPMNCIFPVKCYHEEIDFNSDVDVLLLSALTNILNFANYYVDEIEENKDTYDSKQYY